MKVAVICPLADQSRKYGAERHIAGLHQALSRQCPTDLIEVPVSEVNWDSVLQSYLDCYDLNLSGYDLVISTKNPTFMAQHRNHVCWLIHQIRVFYDRFEEEYADADPSTLKQLKKNQKEIRILDDFAFARVRKIFTNGAEVGRRLKEYNGFDSEPLHPPVDRSGFFSGRQEYFLLPGRLHRWKRVDLAIRAFRQTRVQHELLIPGTGEHEATFRALAQGDSRIKFLGYVSDEELIELYANALAVLFVPKEEDFGYVTVEAMLSHKPVVTCEDSGEPSRILKNGETGYIVPPSSHALAATIDLLSRNPRLAAQLGEKAYQAAPKHSWDDVAEKLLQAGDASSPSAHFDFGSLSTGACSTNGYGPEPRRKVLVADNQVLDPPTGGGRLRIYQLYRHLAEQEHWDITYVGAYDWPGPVFRDQMLFPHFREIVTPLTQVHFRINHWVQRLAGDKTVIDVTVPRLMKYSPRFGDLARLYAAESSIVVISHPWVYPHVPRKNGQFLIYDSHNCEYLIKKQILGSSLVGRLLVNKVKALERELCADADMIFACSDDDAAHFVELYGVDRKKIVLVPNGVDTEAIRPASPERRREAKLELGIEPERPVLIFVGSGYHPNSEAAGFIVDRISHRFPQCTFLIIGSVKDSTPELVSKGVANIRWEGTVDEERKKLLYRAADIALNPMFSGSGTNMKMLDYFAAGLPVVSTPAGARGLLFLPEECNVCEAEEFPGSIEELLGCAEARSAMGAMARALAESRYSWKQICLGAAPALEAAVDRKRAC